LTLKTILFEEGVLRLKGNTMKRQKAFSLLLLLVEVVITLFIAGIMIPSLIRSDLATKEALAAGSLSTINIAGIALSYTHENVEFAILGAFVGAMAALTMDCLAATRKNTTFTRTTTLRAAPLQR
jgi:ABC-type Fe3+-siderophore transport system permease subunit